MVSLPINFMIKDAGFLYNWQQLHLKWNLVVQVHRYFDTIVMYIPLVGKLIICKQMLYFTALLPISPPKNMFQDWYASWWCTVFWVLAPFITISNNNVSNITSREYGSKYHFITLHRLTFIFFFWKKQKRHIM